ncbi:hypothetical protein [Oricola indica]|uniref:hypothetical protein n=1 Tax=Oricola indica TaxID=2872591 RepID=UPI003CCBCD47
MNINSCGMLGKICFGVLFTLSTVSTSYAVDKKQADVVVSNKTGKTILSVTVAHKYSDEYEHQLDWPGVLADGAKTSGQPVTYNTGFGTTGRDWWYVSWVYTDSSTIYYSDPNNFRGAIDFMEKAGKIAIPVGTSIAATVFGAVCTASTAGACGPAATAAVVTTMAAASATIASAAAGELLANGGTKGFKQHILRDDDAGKTVTIELQKKNQILITSPSGDSRTVYASKPTESTPSQLEAINAAISDFKAKKAPDLSGTWDSSYGPINFANNTYYDGDGYIELKGYDWDEGRQAVVIWGAYGKTKQKYDPTTSGVFTWYFKDKCSFSGTWSKLIPEFVKTKSGGLMQKTTPWTGKNPNC